MDRSEETCLTFRMDGPRFNDGIPLFETLTAMHEFHNIIDKAWLAKTNCKRISYKDRRNYGMTASEFRRGSFEADIVLYAAATMNVLPNLSAETAGTIWDITTYSFNLLKEVFLKRSEGKEPKIIVGGDNLAPVVVGSNITVNNTILIAADQSEKSFKKLAKMVSPGAIDSISSLDAYGDGFCLSESDKHLFNPRTRIDNEVITIDCDIFKYDKNSNNGKLTVFEGQRIPAREYSFNPVRYSDSSQFIAAMGRSSVKVHVLREIEIHTTGAERISSLRIVSIDDFKHPGLFD
ncbi:MAG: hypothetical protein AB7U43_11385 [Desulfobacter sp.]